MERARREHEPESGQPAVADVRSPLRQPPPGVSNQAVVRLLGAALRSPGDPLPSWLAAPLGDALSADLSGVRVHTGDDSAAAATALNADAFTVGQDIHFGPGRYDPHSADGQRLLRHEAAHAVQQGPVDLADLGGLAVSRPTDAAEVQAETFAQRAGEVPVTIRAPQPVVHRSTGVESPEEVSHQPRHENEAIAIWDSTLASTVRTSAMIGSFYNALIAAYGPRPEMGHYSTEAAAIAAIRSYGKVGAVFLEDGRYVAYHAHDDSWVYDFSWDNVRWVERKPWTAVRFTGSALAIVTTDGVTLRPQMYTSADEAESRLADQALMPGSDNPYHGYQQVHGDFNQLGEEQFLRAFGLAMRDHSLAVLSRSYGLVQREVERRAPGMTDVPPEELALMRRTAWYLAGLDDEMDAIPKDLPWFPDEMADFQARQERFQALKQRRRVVLARYPMLARVNPREFVKLSEGEQNAQLHGEALGVLRDIDTTRDNIIEGDLDLWTMRPIVESTLAGLGITDADRRAWAIRKHEAEKREDMIISIAMSVFSVGFGLAATFIGGPVGAAFAAGALGLGAADAIMATEQYLVQSAAGNTAMDPDQSLVPPDLAGHWAWLVVAWIGVVADAADVVRAVRAAKATGAISSGIDALAAGDAALAKRLRVAAGEVADGELISEATKAAVGNRVGASIEIQDSLGTEIRVHYSVTSRGDVIVEGIRCGASASVIDILAHAEVVRLLRRYEGVVGTFRHLFDRLVSLGGPNPFRPFPPGSAAFESWLEMKKLPEIIEARRAALGTALGSESEGLLRRDVEFLEAEYRRHAEVVDSLTIEQGAGFIARAEERTAEAIGNGMPKLDGDPLISDPSRYYYRSNPGGTPPYVLSRISTADVPARTLVPDGKGGWKIAEGALSRAEQATAMVAGWPEGARNAFEAYRAAFAGRVVVPLQGVATTGRTIGQLAPDLAERLRVLLLEAFTRAGDPNAANKALDAAKAVADHQLVVVRGTDQLRAFNYRLNFTGSIDEMAEVDLHHIIPLQLGGDHRRLVAVHRDLHDRLHELIDEIPFGEGTLAPHSIRSSADLQFAEGAAVLHPNGSVQLARMNADGTYTLVP